MLYIVSYDIVKDKQRTKLAKQLCNFGTRVQFSVFECALNKDQYNEMIKKILKLIDKKKDSVRIYQLCQNCEAGIVSYGIKKGWEEKDVIVI